MDSLRAGRGFEGKEFTTGGGDLRFVVGSSRSGALLGGDGGVGEAAPELIKLPK